MRTNHLLLILAILLPGILFGCSPAVSNDHTGAETCPQKLPPRMSCIPGGSFTLGSNATDWKNENYDLSAFKVHRVTLSTFLIDQFEVTTEDYQACVQSGKCENQWSNYSHMREPRQPQLKASWYQARQYCDAMGKRLPTEAEFEAASRGPAGEIYPWGNEVASCSKAIIKDETGRGCQGRPDKGWHPTPEIRIETGSTWDVGSKKPWRYGLYDMAGNAQEWVADWYSHSLKECGEGCQGENPRGPCNGADQCPGFEEKLVKGGSWYWGAIAARAAARRPHHPRNDPPHHFGFRCAKSVE